MLDSISLHRITDVEVKPSGYLDSGPLWIDIIVQREHVVEERTEKFELTLFSQTKEDHIALLEQMKQDITNVLQDYDEQLAEEK